MPTLIIYVLSQCTVRLLPCFGLGIHRAAALGAPEQAGQQVLRTPPDRGTARGTKALTLHLGLLKQFFTDDGLVGYGIAHDEVIGLHPLVFVGSALHFFGLGLSVDDEAHVGFTGQDALDVAGVPIVKRSIGIGCGGLGDALAVEIRRDGRIAHVLMHELVKDKPDYGRVVLVDHELAIFEPIAKRRHATVPPAFAGLLLPPQLGMGVDIFPLHLGDGPDNGYHQLAHLAAAVQTVLLAYQVDTVSLHGGQRDKQILDVAAEAGEFEHHHVINVNPMRGNVGQHTLILVPPLNGFAGFASIHIGIHHGHALKLGPLLQVPFLAVEAVALDLPLQAHPEI